nr:MAG TPA: hypothetical protein [Caudoviricetes sp.]
MVIQSSLFVTKILYLYQNFKTITIRYPLDVVS